MAAKSFDPTANPFELLANAENQQEAPERRKKPSRKEEQESASAMPTPAAKAQARAAKEAAKKTTPIGSADTPTLAQAQVKQEKKKLTREQFLEEKRKGNLSELSEPTDNAPVNRPPRARGGDQNSSPAPSNSDRGRGRGNRGDRGGRGGRGRGRGRGGEGDKSGRALGDREHHHVPPAHGREYDRKSGMKTGRHAVAKKGGSGTANWGDEKDDLAGQTGVDTLEAPADEVEKPTTPAAPGTEQAADAPPASEQPVAPTTEPAEEEDKGLLLDDWMKRKAKLDEELAAKVGSTFAPRRVEGDLTGSKEPPKVAELPKKDDKKAKEEPLARKGEKLVAIEELFVVHTPPIARGRGRGRGRRGEGRGDRGEGRGDRGEGRGDRGEGRGDSGEGDRGDDQQRADTGERRGRGRGRGGSGGSGQGRGGQRSRRPQLDSTNPRHFPDLGSGY